MKMIIDKQTFEKVVFAAASANVYVFDAIQDRFEQAEHKLFGTVLGSDTDVDTLPVKEDVTRIYLRHHVIGLNRCACRYSVKRIMRWTVLLRA